MKIWSRPALDEDGVRGREEQSRERKERERERAKKAVSYLQHDAHTQKSRDASMWRLQLLSYGALVNVYYLLFAWN